MRPYIVSGGRSVQLLGDSLLARILPHFPPVQYAFAYGSGVFAQETQPKGKMLDLIFVVDNPREWHRENLQENFSHYSSLRRLGAKTITWIQERMGCGIYYNPFVTLEGQLLKYGVISTASLTNDLMKWKRIYVAGRLHKPVLELKSPGSATLLHAIWYNREAALRTVLLQEGRYLSKYNLFHGITELSYLGDSRMKLAENPDKTKNIVTPLVKEFDYLYTPIIQSLYPLVEIDKEGLLIQCTTPQDRFKHLMALPYFLQIMLCRQLFRDPRLCDIEEVMAELSYMPQLRNYLRASISQIVWSSSIRQTLQGIFTAGLMNSTKYAWDKLQKGMKKGSSSTPQG